VSTAFDAVVVGAGPAGSAAALTLARAGRSVLLVERGEFPGSKNVSGAAVYSPDVLEALIPRFWESAPIERTLTRRVICVTSDESSVSLDFKSRRFAAPPYNAFSVLRPRFDRWLADQAVAAGAVLLNATVVDEVLRDASGRVNGVRVRREGGEIEAPVVIAADGVNSFLARGAGLQRELTGHDLSLGVKEVIALDRHTVEERFNLEPDEGVTYEFLGSVTGEVAGGSFLYTNRESLSLGVIVEIASLAERRVRPYELLERFKAHPTVAPLVRGGRLVEYSAHMVPEAGQRMLATLAADGMLVAGDAAGLCFATGLYLEGINYAIASGRAAGEAAAEALAAGDTSAAGLAGYQRRLETRGVLPDFRRFRLAPRFVMGERMHTLYPGIVTGIAERVLRSQGGRPKQKLLPAVAGELRRAGVPLRRVLRDLWEGGRAFGW
jgi:electron transfer flavoprotein-quinone oxidoreductase